MPECPICEDPYGGSGFHSHIKSHDEDELAAAVIELVMGDSERNDSDDSGHGANDSWQTTKTTKKAVEEMRKERDDRVQGHLNRLDSKVKGAL